jgi:hypothetical protein
MVYSEYAIRWSTLYTILSSSESQTKKSNMNSLIYFLFLQLQSTNFKALVISTSLVIGT